MPLSITDARIMFRYLAEQVRMEHHYCLGTVYAAQVQAVLAGLREYLPGLEAPSLTEYDNLERHLNAGRQALDLGLDRRALVHAFLGLRIRPYPAALFTLAGSASLTLGATATAIRLFRHALWVHPGFTPARDELATIHDCLDQPPDRPR